MIGENLAKYREIKGWSQGILAEISKVPQSAISEIENGKRKNPGFETITKLANALEISLSDLIDANDNPA